MDIMTKEERSIRMSKIRSRWTKPEKRIHNYLKGRKIKHKMHPDIAGKPDIIIKKGRKAIFIQGCFWHKCPKCYREPKSRKKYWLPKIESNVKRDRKNTQALRKEGYGVIRIWEHQLEKDLDGVLKRVLK